MRSAFAAVRAVMRSSSTADWFAWRPPRESADRAHSRCGCLRCAPRPSRRRSRPAHRSGWRAGNLLGGRGLFGIQLGHPAGKHNPQPGAKLIAQRAVALCLRGLPLQRAHLPRDFVEDVVHARKIRLGRFQPELRQPLLGLEPRNPRGLFEDRAPIERLRAEQLADALLPDDRVGLATKARAHEDVLNIAQPADLAVQQILAVARTKQPPRNRHFACTNRSPPELAPPNLQHNIVRSWRAPPQSVASGEDSADPWLRLR